MGKLISFAIPLFLSSLFGLLYSAADTWVLGNFVGDTAYAAVGAINPINNLIINTTNGFATGIGIVFAQCFGAKDAEQLKKTRSTAVYLILFFGILCTVAGVCFTPALLRMTEIPDELFEEARIYLTIMFAASVSRVINLVAAALLRAIGDTARSVTISVGCNTLNVPLNLLFVIVFKMGVEGVAFATVICFVVESVLYARILLRDDSAVRIDLREVKFYGENVWKVVKVAVPVALQLALTSVSNLFFQRYTNVFGPLVLGGYTTFVKIEALNNYVMGAFSLSISNFVGQNIGAKKVKRAKRGIWVGLALSGGFALFSTVVCMVGAPYIGRFFNKNEEILYYACYLTRLVMPFSFFHSIMHGLTGALRGAGNSQAAMLISLISFVGIRQLYLYIVTTYFAYTVETVYMGYAVSWGMGALIFVVYFLLTKLDKRRLV